MKYTVVSSAEFTYPDIFEYATSSQRIDIFSARKSYATFQLLFADCASPEIAVEFEGIPADVEPEIYTLRSVMVERNQNLEEKDFLPHIPERRAPYRVYDCLRTFDGTLDLTDGQGGLYIAFRVPENAEPGVYQGTVSANGVKIPLSLEIFAAVVPDETLTMINGYSSASVEKFHHVEKASPEYYALEEKYLALLRRMHQNMMYTGRVSYKTVGENRYEFDFSSFIAQVERYEKAGMKYFNAPSVGGRRSWKESTILVGGSIPSMSYEGYCYLMQYLPALKKVLDEHGWTNRFVMGVADEPNAENCTEYRALCGLVHRIVPEIRLCDAMSYGNLHGALDVWVPVNMEYDRYADKIETFRSNGAEIWHYVCCIPREEGYINRFMDYPLLSTRYLHWGNYKYNLTGYLHWASNCYQPGQDPFELNCPEHHNADNVCYLPAGDTHIVYPGTDGPWMSIRLEAQRESAEEYELLKELAKTDKVKADAICEKVFHSFKNVEYDAAVFCAAKRELLANLSK